MTNGTSLAGIFLLALLSFLGVNAIFVVSEFERAVLLEFGKVVRADIKPGLHFKLPSINEVRKFDARLFTSDEPAERDLRLE